MSWDSYIKQGILAVADNDFERAEQAFKEALQVAKDTYSRSDDRLALTLSLLGQVYFRRRDFAQAERLLEQSLRLNVSCDSPIEPAMIMDAFSLGEIKMHKGSPDEAVRLYVDMLERVKKAGERPSEELRKASQRFEQLLEEGKRKSASHKKPEQCADSSSASTTAAQPANTSQTAPPSFFEAWVKQLGAGREYLMSDEEAAEDFVSAYLNFESALRIARVVFAANDVRVAETMVELARAAGRLRMVDLADQLFADSLELLRHCEQSTPAQRALLQLTAASYYAENDRFDTAEKLYDETAPLLADADDQTGALDQAQENFRKAYTRAKLFASAHELSSQAQQAEQAGDLEKASKLYHNALSILKQGYSPDHPEIGRLLFSRARVLRQLGNEPQAEELEKRAERIEKANHLLMERWRSLTETLPLPNGEPAHV